MKKLEEYVICCKDGIYCKSAQTGSMFWCWEYKDMDIYGKDELSKVVKEIMAKFIQDNDTLDFKLRFFYEDKNIKDMK